MLAASPTFESALGIAAAVRTGDTTVVDVVATALEQARHWGPVVGAFVTLTEDAALEHAAQLDARLAAGGTPTTLYGVPTSIKDFVDVAGAPTQFGSTTLAHNVAPRDDNTTVALREAGLVSLGKSTVPEFGLTCFTEPRNAAPARTPWNLKLSAAGSSGGAASGVAAGIVPVAQGSDSGGSLRSPASVCGLVGLKTSRGRVSFGTSANDGLGLSVRGPLARGTADAAAMLDVLAKRFPGDLLSPPMPDRGFLAGLDRDPGRLRIATYVTAPSGDDVDPACVSAANEVAELLANLGHDVQEIKCPVEPTFLSTFLDVFASLAAAVTIPEQAEGRLEPFTQWLRARAESTTAPSLAGALATVTAMARSAVAATSTFDLILTPTLGMLPQPVGSMKRDNPRECWDLMCRFSAFTPLDNVTGRPAVNVPVIWTAQGLPAGVQLTASWGREDLLLSMCHQLEAARPWTPRRPLLPGQSATPAP